ncbi:MAG: hypothetical protein ACK4GT_00265 [Pararhodobacter sp.]
MSALDDRIEGWNIHASLAVEQYVDHRCDPPESWADLMIELGVGERRTDGSLRLTDLGHRYRRLLSRR